MNTNNDGIGNKYDDKEYASSLSPAGMRLWDVYENEASAKRGAKQYGGEVAPVNHNGFAYFAVYVTKVR